MRRHSLSFALAVQGALVIWAIWAGSPAAASAGPFGKGYPLPGDGYRLVEAELVDRRTGRFEFWQQHHDTSGKKNEVATFADLTLRNSANWQGSLGLGTYAKERIAGAAFTNVQFKQMWREMYRDGYGLGIAAGLHHDYSHGNRHDHYVILPAAWQWGQRTTLQANAGAVYDHQAEETEGLWALSLDWRFTENWDVLLQLSDDTANNTDMDGVFGLRRTMLHDLVQIDFAYGREMTSGAHDEVYFGIRFDAIRF